MSPSEKKAAERTAVFKSSSSRESFTFIFSEALTDPNISYRAKGILAACLSLPADFEFTRRWIEEHGTEGRDTIITALKELRSRGYLKNVKIRNSEGRIQGEHYMFSDQPCPRHPSPDEPAGQFHQRPEKPDAGISGLRFGAQTPENSVTVPLYPESTAATEVLVDQPQKKPTRVDTVSKLPAYRVGAGTSGNEETESVSSLRSQGSQPERQGSLQLESQLCSKDLSPLHTVGEGVGKESEETPREPLVISDPLKIPAWLEPCRGHLLIWLENRRKKHKLNPELTKFTLNGLLYAKELGVLAEYCEYAAEMNWRSLGFVGYRDLIQKLAKQSGKMVKSDKPPMADIVYTLGIDK